MKEPIRYSMSTGKPIKEETNHIPLPSLNSEIQKYPEPMKDDIFDKKDLQKMNVLRRIIAPMGTMDAIEFINSKLKNTKNNAEFFNSMNKPA